MTHLHPRGDRGDGSEITMLEHEQRGLPYLFKLRHTAKESSGKAAAMGGGARGNGKKARAGLVRALMAHKGYEADARLWAGRVANDYRFILLEDGKEVVKESMNAAGKLEAQVVALAKVLRCRVRYFTGGAVIGSRGFVNEAFEGSRDRFGKQRKDEARKMRGTDSALAAAILSLRDFKKDFKQSAQSHKI